MFNKTMMSLVATLLLLGPWSLQSALAAIFQDVAIHPTTGETFIVENTKNGSLSRILVLRDDDLTSQKWLSLFDQDEILDHLEIELYQDDRLAFLAQSGGHWMLGSLVRDSSGEWKRADYDEVITSAGFAAQLGALPGGVLSLAVYDHSSPQGSVLLVSDTQGNGSSLEVVERISAEQLLAASVELDSNTSEKKSYGSDHGVGFSAGLLSGLGIAYRRHFENKIGIQITAAPWGGRDYAVANAGLNFLYTLDKKSFGRFLLIAGTSTYYSGHRKYNWDACNDPSDRDGYDPYTPCDPTTEEWDHMFFLNFGVGIGMELALTDYLGLSLELPFVLNLTTQGKNGLNFNGIYPVPSASLIYYFDGKN
jgi:hypothetical protein